MKSGFVAIFGKPNAGKSTLLNALIGQKLSIVSKKVQTTRHRIKGFLTVANEYQIIFSDTPGIIEPKYKLHERMIASVKNALEDSDVALLLVDVNGNLEEEDGIFSALNLNVASIIVLNKIDKQKPGAEIKAGEFFRDKQYVKAIISISALQKINLDKLLQTILNYLPEGNFYYSEDELTDLPLKFFVAEIIREKIYDQFEEEIPYHSTVIVNEFKERPDIIKIQADIIVQRESQKSILLGENGSKIKQLGISSRSEIEELTGKKVYLELFVRVKPKWRNSELYLKNYGY